MLVSGIQAQRFWTHPAASFQPKTPRFKGNDSDSHKRPTGPEDFAAFELTTRNSSALPDIGEILKMFSDADVPVWLSPVLTTVINKVVYASLKDAKTRILPYVPLQVVLPFNTAQEFDRFDLDQFARHLGVPRKQVLLEKVLNFSDQVVLDDVTGNIYSPMKYTLKRRQQLGKTEPWFADARKYLKKPRGKLIALIGVSQNSGE